MRTGKRFSKTERSRWVRRFQKSGLSAAAFSRKHGIGHQSLLNWSKASDAEGRPEPETKADTIGFIEVELEASGEVAAARTRDVAAELELPCGIRIRIFEPVSSCKR